MSRALVFHCYHKYIVLAVKSLSQRAKREILKSSPLIAEKNISMDIGLYRSNFLI